MGCFNRRLGHGKSGFGGRFARLGWSGGHALVGDDDLKRLRKTMKRAMKDLQSTFFFMQKS
jgi:hypothetical protein